MLQLIFDCNKSQSLIFSNQNHRVCVCNVDYVCVLDIDLLELAITTWKGNDSGKLVRAHHLFLLTCTFFICNGQKKKKKKVNVKKTL